MLRYVFSYDLWVLIYFFLAKFMITSHRIAEEKCSLLFTILERSGLKSVVCTILASFPDLLVRHPNTMEPWTKVGLKTQNFAFKSRKFTVFPRAGTYLW